MPNAEFHESEWLAGQDAESRELQFVLDREFLLTAGNVVFAAIVVRASPSAALYVHEIRGV